MHEARIWITGVGAATPLGFDFETVSRRLLAGESAARRIVDRKGEGEFHSPGCTLPEVPLPANWTEQEFRRLRRDEQAAVWCGAAALADAGLGEFLVAEQDVSHDASRPLRVGLILGAGGEWLRTWETATLAGRDDMYVGNDGESLVAATHRRLGLAGPTTTIGAACASANFALALARNWLERGWVDVCLAGGVETVTPICRGNFHNLRALSRRADDAGRASRPFDKDRDGLVMGEGAVLFALERSETARRRGATPYAEVAGFGATSDAFHMIIPGSDPAPVAGAMQKALADARIEPHQVDYVNAHATSTPVGDVGEARALRKVFGPHTATTPVSSTKSMTGHLLSAAAAVEALAALTAIRHQALPPTINLDQPDPECDLCHVRHEAVAARVDTVLSNSFGFGGNNTALVLQKVA